MYVFLYLFRLHGKTNWRFQFLHLNYSASVHIYSSVLVLVMFGRLHKNTKYTTTYMFYCSKLQLCSLDLLCEVATLTSLMFTCHFSGWKWFPLRQFGLDETKLKSDRVFKGTSKVCRCPSGPFHEHRLQMLGGNVKHIPNVFNSGGKWNHPATPCCWDLLISQVWNCGWSGRMVSGSRRIDERWCWNYRWHPLHTTVAINMLLPLTAACFFIWDIIQYILFIIHPSTKKKKKKSYLMLWCC